MTVLQLYYTSCTNTATGYIGFQVKAMSPGIAPHLQATIMRLVAYRIPSTLDIQIPATHPVALRYYYVGPNECIFLCSQSSGADDNGRPGNFFAHTLVMPPDIFRIAPPILFWKSPFWREADPESRSQVASLPVLTEFEEAPSFDYEQIWGFLAQGDRRQQLYKLMCAIVHATTTYRRIVILDTIEHIVLWITAVSCLLPPAYRPLLSFATYHHDPYQGLFLITGTTSDSLSRASTDDYLSYFVLNAETGMTSEVEASPYAQMVVDSAYPDPYETELLTLFTNYAHRFPEPTAINEQLDLFARYAQLQTGHHGSAFTTQDIDAIRLVLSTFEQLPEWTQEDIDELQRLKPVLVEMTNSQYDSKLRAGARTEYERVVKLLKMHSAT